MVRELRDEAGRRGHIGQAVEQAELRDRRVFGVSGRQIDDLEFGQSCQMRRERLSLPILELLVAEQDNSFRGGTVGRLLHGFLR